MEKKIRVAAYARVSTDKDDQANSFESQVEYFTEYIQREPNWELVKVYSDEGITGTNTLKRDGFKEMVADAYIGKIDLIITKSVSRFARNTLDSIGYTRELAKRDVFVIFTTDAIDTRQADAELRLTIMAALAQEESRKTSENVKWGQLQRMKKGVVFGRDMLGYKVKDGQLFLVEEEAEIVKLIYHKYLHEGKGTHVIARELKEAGIRPLNPDGNAKYKNDWSNTVILRVLRNEKYVGDLKQKKTYTKSFLDHKKRYNRGEEDMVYIRDHHPEIAIIDRETWDATQAELERRSPSDEQKAKHSNRYWASGKIFCGVCGGRFINKLKKTSQGTTRAWNCMNHVKAAAFREAECKMTESASDKSLKTCCLYALNLMVEDKDRLIKEIRDEIASLYGGDNTDKKRNAIKSKIEKLENKKYKLIDLRLADEITAQELKEQKERIDNEIFDLKGQLVSLEEESMVLGEQAAKLNEIFAEIERIASFEDTEIDGVLSSVVEKIIVYPGRTVEVRLKALPMGFKMVYKSTGKLDTYRTTILSCEIV